MRTPIILSLILMTCIQTSFSAEVRKLSVTGNSSVYKAADELNLIIGFENTDREVAKAAEINADHMNAVVAALAQMGLSGKEVQTKNYSIEPLYTPPPKNPSIDWQPAIAGYRISNTLEIRTDKLDKAGEIIDLVSAKGANLIQKIFFSLKDKQQAQAEAIALAVHQAQAYAEAAAESAGIKLGGIIELTINHTVVNTQFLKSERLMQASATPITPQDVEVAASVSIVYEMDSMD